MFFEEVRFPVEISYGSSFSSEYQVQVVNSENANRYTRMLHPYPIFRLSASLERRQHSEMIEQVVSLFHTVGGKAGGFRVKHFLDFTTNNFIDPPTSSDQLLLAGEVADTWQLVRWYGTEGEATATRRVIRKPVEDTVLVEAGGVQLDDTQFEVDLTTGIISWTANKTDTVTGISQAVQAVVTVGSSPLVVGESVVFSGVLGMTEINGLRGEIVAKDATTITVDIDTTGFSAYTSGGTVDTNPDPAEVIRGGCEFDIPCYFEDDLGDISYGDFDALDVSVSLREILNP